MNEPTPHFSGQRTPPHDGVTFTSQALIQRAGITYRQLDYWCRTGLLTTVNGNEPGSGHTRLFAVDQVERAVVIGELTECGFGLQWIRVHIDDLLAGDHIAIGPLTLTYSREAS